MSWLGFISCHSFPPRCRAIRVDVPKTPFCHSAFSSFCNLLCPPWVRHNSESSKQGITCSVKVSIFSVQQVGCKGSSFAYLTKHTTQKLISRVRGPVSLPYILSKCHQPVSQLHTFRKYASRERIYPSILEPCITDERHSWPR